MSTAVQAGVLLVAAAMVVGQVLRCWSRGRFAAPSRYELVSSTVDAVVVLAAVRAVASPPAPLSWLWVAAAVAVGVGVAGAVLRWPALGWAPPAGTHGAAAPRRRTLLAAAYVVVGGAVVALLA